MPDSLIITPSSAPFLPALPTCTPTRLFDEIATALAPLDNGSGCYKGGNEATLVAALKPWLGGFTIADACILAGPMWDQTWICGCPEVTHSNLGKAYFLLRDFICSASASSPRDVGARVDFWRKNHGRGLNEENEKLLTQMMSEDIGDLLSQHFADGQLFGGEMAFPEQDDVEPSAWWDDRRERLLQLRQVQ